MSLALKRMVLTYPNTPSTCPRMSICSRRLGAMVVMLTFDASNPAILASAGKSLSAPSFAAPPSVRPSKSFGVLIGLSVFTATVNGGRL